MTVDLERLHEVIIDEWLAVIEDYRATGTPIPKRIKDRFWTEQQAVKTCMLLARKYARFL